MCLGRVWTPLGSILVPFGLHFGSIWPPFWLHFGSLWVPFLMRCGFHLAATPGAMFIPFHTKVGGSMCDVVWVVFRCHNGGRGVLSHKARWQLGGNYSFWCCIMGFSYMVFRPSLDPIGLHFGSIWAPFWLPLGSICCHLRAGGDTRSVRN